MSTVDDPLADATAGMELRGLAADAMRERDDLRAKLKAADLVHIRLRAGLREALDGWETTWTSDNNDEPPREIAELRKLVTP